MIQMKARTSSQMFQLLKHQSLPNGTLRIQNFIQILLVTLVIYSYLRDKLSSTYSENSNHSFIVMATSINYGITHQPITDVNQLMPKLCQNQTVICEGSFCIPGVRKCVCDLRMPVQFGRFCLRQLDIETKCFVTSQCNHTVKDAVCLDMSSNSILDSESSKFKLDQWQQLNDLRQMSQSIRTQENSSPLNQTTRTNLQFTQNKKQKLFIFGQSSNNILDGSFNFKSQDDLLYSNVRNSPYEINYDTNELLSQNHTKRRMNHIDRTSTLNPIKDIQNTERNTLSMDSTLEITTSYIIANEATDNSQKLQESRIEISTSGTSTNNVQASDSELPPTTTVSYGESTGRKKVIKNPQWPPGICSCPFGFMFDSMLRKCLALSLDDSHCQVDSDCKQIVMAHCSLDSKKCKCDEPFVWNQTELACVRPKPQEKIDDLKLKNNTSSFLENLIPPLILAKILPDYTMMLLLFIIFVVLGTLIILRLTVKCFSSNSSALISPKNNKKKKLNNSNNLPPRSPYATLRRPDHKPNSQLSNFTQATKGRILNYDFEQEETGDDSDLRLPHPSSTSNTLRSSKNVKANHYDKSGGFKNKGQKSHIETVNKTNELIDKNLELVNDNGSLSQLESESKSDNSVLTIPDPPPTQQPPYMFTSVMKGQGSAIAAAAAAVANKRMQMAQKKNMDQQTSNRISNGSPVFL